MARGRQDSFCRFYCRFEFEISAKKTPGSCPEGRRSNSEGRGRGGGEVGGGGWEEDQEEMADGEVEFSYY